MSRNTDSSGDEASTVIPLSARIGLTYQGAADLLSTSESSIRKAVYAGRLPASKIAGIGVRIARSDLEAYLEQHPYEPAA
ncbi:helix-turn-helix domain-containing protein [Rhodococcoides fascians]|uniref:helix-turn-helix domain-containing protein n=1 Tax=Rhodococcoides fascians TaxID=1828 RepID=UPI00050CCFB7|nr:helix-turn-helix domain-containing protein [Rhodococcus fascians]